MEGGGEVTPFGFYSAASGARKSPPSMVKPADPCRQPVDVHSTRTWGAKLHYLLAGTDFSTEANGNVGQAPGN